MTISSTMERSYSLRTFLMRSILSLIMSQRRLSYSSASSSSFSILKYVNYRIELCCVNLLEGTGKDGKVRGNGECGFFQEMSVRIQIYDFDHRVSDDIVPFSTLSGFYQYFLPSQPILSYFYPMNILMYELSTFRLYLNTRMAIPKHKWLRMVLLALLAAVALGCDPCYNQNMNLNCGNDGVNLPSYTLHMSVHPHLDAYWIFNFESYYDPKPNEGGVHGYFMSNRFNSVKEIFTATKRVLWESKRLRENVSNKTQQAHRTFFNSEMGFFKRWFSEQNSEDKDQVKQLLKTKYWEILGGGYVEHDEGCAYYDDIIENFELGLHFLKQEFEYFPRVAVSADSFGHSQTSLAILAHLGVEGYFVERSDEHILLKNKTQFIWRAKSANGRVYGALPTHIRWAIHGFEDQFIGGNMEQNFCQTKEGYINNLRNENTFLKRILKSTHVMRYFGHDFQRFDEYSYAVIEGMMKKFSLEKCNKVVAVYGNPTEYFITLMGEVFGRKVKPVVTRSEDIFPIWDYDSGLYWTGYFTTDAYHKKNYRDMGRLLRGVRKLFLPIYRADPSGEKQKTYYDKLESLAEQVSYLQHHDGISGTSKYTVMDQLELQNHDLSIFVHEKILSDIFIDQFPEGTNSPIFTCYLDEPCTVPLSAPEAIYLKVLNTDGNLERDPLIVALPEGAFYEPNCEYEVNCFCMEDFCPCKLYLFPRFSTYTAIKLKKVLKEVVKINKLTSFVTTNEYYNNNTHFKIKYGEGEYALGYKRVEARGTNRNYEHLSRYGGQYSRSFNIRPGKYALGNDPNSARDLTSISSISQLKSDRYNFFLIHWRRHQMKTLISIPRQRPNEWKVETIAATEGYYLQDLYFEVITPIDNKNKFVTDSNGWLTVQREMFKHEDYEAFFSDEKFDDLDGNSYPATAFAYIKDKNDKVSINLERPQGVTAYRKGTLWVNFDRLSEDDGKWVYQSAVRSEYQKYTHVVTVKNSNYNERKIQRRYDQPLFVQGNSIPTDKQIDPSGTDFSIRSQWNAASSIDNLKFSIRPFNDSTTILRVHNLHDEQEVTIGLFAGKISPLLTTYYGRAVSFSSVTEQSLGGNMEYSQFVNAKWNWKSVADLTEENRIFNKVFRENITLTPLEIRTFLFKDLKFDKCIEPKDLTYTKMETPFQLNTDKPPPTRDPLTIQLQKQIVQFMLEGDKCSGKNPILDRSNVNVEGTASSGKVNIDFKPRTIEKPNPVTPPADEDQLQIIESKVNAFKPLSHKEKLVYFRNILDRIRLLKPKAA